MADLRALEDRLLKAISAAAEETKRHFEDTKRHFDVVAENLTYDYRGIFSDRLEQLRDRQTDHERRLRRLEDRAGVIA